MSDSRKYYYLKLKDNFFESMKVILLRDSSSKNGEKYIVLLLKMYLLSLQYDGLLMLDEDTPLTESDIAATSHYSTKFVKEAINEMIKYGLVKRLPNNTFIMMEIQNYIGLSSTEADRKRKHYRKAKELETSGLDKISNDTPEISPPELKSKTKFKKDPTDTILDHDVNRDDLDDSERAHYTCPKCGGTLYNRPINGTHVWCHLDGWMTNSNCNAIFDTVADIKGYSELPTRNNPQNHSIQE